MKTYLVTGAAGFIGMHVSQALLERGDKVIGIDNLNDYYDPKLKEQRLEQLKHENFTFHKIDIADAESLNIISGVDIILHMAAQAGVRYSIDNPQLYIDSNIKGALNLLELARHNNIKHFVFASSSSVYGGIKEYPFREDMKTDNPISLYAATKKSGELMCHAYHTLYHINFRILRYFTVYGPWGRPDMAPFKFTEKIANGEMIDVYNNGDMGRDFTYIKDIVDATIAAADSDLQFEIFNIGRGKPEKLMDFIKAIEKAVGKEANKNMMPMQPGDVKQTFADISKAKELLNYNPGTDMEEGITEFVEWYKGWKG